MRLLNFLGNKFFSILVSYIVSSNVTDTLCGTKCFRRSDWEIYEEFRERNRLNDIWGDFNKTSLAKSHFLQFLSTKK